MTSDDQHFLDYLNGVSSSISGFVYGLGRDADKAVSDAVNVVRHGLKKVGYRFGTKIGKTAAGSYNTSDLSAADIGLDIAT